MSACTVSACVLAKENGKEPCLGLNIVPPSSDRGRVIIIHRPRNPRCYYAK